MALGHEHMPHDLPAGQVHASGVVRRADRIREGFAIAQAVSLAAGIFFVVTGAVGLARGGVDSMTGPVVTVAGLSMTPALALGHLALGVLLAAGVADRGLARGMLTFAATILFALGIVVLIEPIRQLGARAGNGVAYVIVGVVALGATLATPLVAIDEERRIEELDRIA